MSLTPAGGMKCNDDFRIGTYETVFTDFTFDSDSNSN